MLLRGRVVVLHRPHPQKETSRATIRDLREFLIDTGLIPMMYKGYTAKVVYDGEEGVLRGRVEGIRDIVTFEAANADDVEREFRLSIDEYLAFCAEQGITPEQPGSERLRATA